MNLDDLLRQPLADVRDDGFSARITLAAAQKRERNSLLLWIAAAAALLPPLLLLPLAQAGEAMAATLNASAASPFFALTTGSLVLLWALRPRPFRL